MRELTGQLKSYISEFVADVLGVVASRERMKRLFRISLYSNALYLMMANVTGSLLGFVFWIMAARLSSPKDVGLATAGIAAMGLLATISHLGLGTGLIKFLPRSGKDANLMINTAFSIAASISIVAALIFIAGLGLWSPALLFIRQDPSYLTAFVFFTAAFSIWMLVGQTFVAERRVGFTLAISLIFNLLKLLLLVLLATSLHAIGIIASWGIPLVIAFLVSVFLFLPHVRAGYRPRFAIGREITRKIMPFSFINHLSGLLWGVPVLVLPVIVVNLLGAESNAYFYMAWTAGSALNMIPGSIAASLFAEGSHEEARLGSNIRRSLRMVFLLLVPAIILVVAFADKLHLLFGNSHSENAADLLRIVALAALPLAVNSIYLAVKRVEGKLRTIIGLSAFVAVATIGLSYPLLRLMGINGVGIAWLAVQEVVALAIMASLFLKRMAVGKTVRGQESP